MKRKLLGKTHLYEEAQVRLNELTILQQQILERICKYPNGKIKIKVNNREGYYIRVTPQEKTGRYISHKDVKTLKVYLQKSYDEKVLKEIEEEIKLLNKMFKNKNSDCDFADKIQNVYSKYPRIAKELIIPVDITDEEYIKRWNAREYEGKKLRDDVPDYITDRNEHVRSKSEVLIANMLNKYNVPYKYECPLKLKKGMTIYPDFTILDVHNRREAYWEHRGMMDNRDYARDSVERIKDYSDNNLLIGDDLIITEETSIKPLSTQEIRRIIERRFF